MRELAAVILGTVQIGDHDPEPSRHAAELYAVSKTSWSVEEYRALADRFSDAVQAFQIAVENESFAGIRSAYLDLADITFKANEMNEGIRHAIEMAKGETRR